MNAEWCEGCSERPDPGGVGWCRMFRLRPDGLCKKHTDPRKLLALSPDAMSELFLASVRAACMSALGEGGEKNE